ncbi:hypothetical protein AGLY_009411 [Aphis glycines]|uniref:Testicular haploid expressed protein n=1 Tax=Aphis glycines TaxID=307491 RepID=A0A6G0THG0_APHGL|nr:hypothetical protein AGLY_009411 [Aphis glycines]
MMTYQHKYMKSLVSNIFEHHNYNRTEQKFHVSFNGPINKKYFTEDPKAENIERLLLSNPMYLNPDILTQIELAQMTSSNAQTVGYRPSSRIERLAMPLPRWRKPQIRLRNVNKKVNRKIPWCKKGPKAPDDKVQVIRPPPLPARTKTGVSRAALKYEATDHIKRLAKHRPIPKKDDDKKFFSVKPLSLIYKPSPRINELAKPRHRNVKK